MKWVGTDHADPQPLDIDHAGHRPDRGGGFLRHALGRAVEQGFDRGARQPQAEQRDHHRHADRRRGVAPGIAQPGQRKPEDDGDRAEHVGGKMQGIGGQRLAPGVARGAMQRPGAPEVDGDVDQQHQKRDRRQRHRRRALAQPAVGFDQDAARQHIEHRDHDQRRQAFELAVAVMMLRVGGAVGNPHHHPGHDGRDQVDRRVQGLGDQGQAADGDADRELGGGHGGAGKDRDRGDAGFDGVNGLAHGRGCSSPSGNIKAPSGGGGAVELQQSGYELL